MINFTARIKNKTFWLTLIPAVLLLVQVVAAPFGYQWDFGVMNERSSTRFLPCSRFLAS